MTETTTGDLSLASATIAKVASGRLALADVWESLTPEVTTSAEVGTRKAPHVPAITDSQKAALKRLPEIYGRITPTEDRLLTNEELALLVEERHVIDEILTLVKSRKDNSIRETLANHLDHIYESEIPDDKQRVPVDAKGHYFTKQEVPVEGSGQKIQKTVSKPKPTLSAADVLAAHEAGQIDRKTYLAITKVPDVPRVLDEDGLVKAIKKDPSLLFTLSGLTRVGSQTITIKVVDDK